MPKSSYSVIQRLLSLITRLAIPILIVGLGVVAYNNLSQQSEEAKRPDPKQRNIRTRVTPLSVQDYPVSLTTQGIVESHNEITLSGQVSGQIVKLSEYFEEGAFVSKGEVLIELDDREYVASLKTVEATRLGALSRLKLAQLDQKRTLAGFEQASLSAVTQADVDLADATLSGAEANLDVADAALELAKLDLERTKIRAPFDGRIRQKLVGLGQTLNPGTASAVIFAVDYAEVRLPISSLDREFVDLPELKDAKPIPVELRDALDPESETTWQAQIVRTEGALDQGSLELVAVARINDPFGLQSGNVPLRIGQPVTGTIRGETLSNVIAIPRAAVRELDQVILIGKTDLRLRKTTIEPVWSDEEFIIVRNPEMYEGVLLATTHIVYAPEGAPVEIIPDIELPVSNTGQSEETDT